MAFETSSVMAVSGRPGRRGWKPTRAFSTPILSDIPRLQKKPQRPRQKRLGAYLKTWREVERDSGRLKPITNRAEHRELPRRPHRGAGFLEDT